MKCVICKHGDTCNGRTTVTLNRDSLTLVVKDVPALICDNCGEEYVEDHVAEQLLSTAGDSLNAGVQVDIRRYVAT